MATSEDGLISQREKRSSAQEDLRVLLVRQKADRLRYAQIGVLGQVGTGCHTLVERFFNMHDRNINTVERHDTRTILIELADRPNIQQNETVMLKIHILSSVTNTFGRFLALYYALNSLAVVFDASQGESIDVAISKTDRIRERMGNDAPPFIMIGNKIDVLLPVDTMMDNRSKGRNCGADGYYECSALKNLNVQPVLDAILIMTFFDGTPLPPNFPPEFL